MSEKFRQLIERVHDKTVAGTLHWREAAADDAFETELGQVTLLVFQGHTPEEALPYVGVTLYDANGRVLENETFPESPGFGSGRAEGLYRLARSNARRSEQTIDELLRELG